jgi:hypothetical protein
MMSERIEPEETLEDLFAEESQPSAAQEPVSRRQFLLGAAAGGAAGLAVAAGTGVVVWKVADGDLLEAKEAAEAELQAAQAAADAEMTAAEEAKGAIEIELAELMGLVDLYEELDKIGLDEIVAKGLAAVALPLGAVEVGANTLKRGLEWAEQALVALGEALPTAQESLLWLENQVSVVADAIQNVEDSVRQALDKASDNRVAGALADLSNAILDYLPFGLGDRFRGALEGLVALATSIDELVEGINTNLLDPLNEKWFSGEEGQGVGGTLVDPLIEKILDPVEALLVNLAVVADNWQNDLKAPTEKALAERTRIRNKIAQYKGEHGLT